MPVHDASQSIVRLDQGGINARILARETATDFRRVEAAGLKLPVRLASAEAKRLFARHFQSFQLHSHFLSTIARIRIDDERISRLEHAARAAVDAAAQRLNQAMDEVDDLFKAHSIQQAASYDTVAMEMEVSVLSSLSRRYLETIMQMDRLMPALQTLEILEILTASEIDRRRRVVKRDLRTISRDLRAVATGLRQEMGPPPTAVGVASPSSPAEAMDATAAAKESPAAPAAPPVQLGSGARDAGLTTAPPEPESLGVH